MDPNDLENVTRAICASQNCSSGHQIGSFKSVLVVDTSQRVLTTLNDIATLFAILLNCISLVVFHRGKKIELGQYLFHLAVADLIFSFKQVIGHLIFHFQVAVPMPCTIWAFSVGLALFVSMYIMVAIAVNRYYALLKPEELLVGSLLTDDKNRIIISVWLLGILFCSPLLLIYRWDTEFQKIGLYFYCEPVGKGRLLNYFQGISVFVLTFLVPFVLLSFLFWRIKRFLSRYQAPGTANVARDRAIRQKHEEAINMLAVVVVLFAALWLPPQIYMVMHDLCESYLRSLPQSTHVRLHLLFNAMAQVHSCVNPIVYSFMSTRFREELNKLMPWLARSSCFATVNKRRSTNLLPVNGRGEGVPRAIESISKRDDHLNQMAHGCVCDVPV